MTLKCFNLNFRSSFKLNELGGGGSKLAELSHNAHIGTGDYRFKKFKIKNESFSDDFSS